MKLNYSQKILILSSTILVVVLILNIVYANLLLAKITSINDKIKQLNISSQQRENELNLKDSIIDSKLGREKLAEYFVGSGDAETVEFTKYLENLAKEVGVIQKKTLEYEMVKGFESSEVISSIHYKFNITGSWASIFNFLLIIENLPKAISLNSVSFNVNTGVALEKEIDYVNKGWSADLDFSVVKIKN